jgi:polysaccharide deacetylase
MPYLDVSIFSVLLVVAVVLSYPDIQLTTVLGQSNEPTDDEESNDMPTRNNYNESEEKERKAEKNNYNDDDNRFVILTFDGGYKSHFTIVKPILDKYNFKATFYVVCNYAQKGGDSRMNWNDITELHKEGHDIGSNTMSHIRLHNIPVERMQYEVGTSDRCLLAHGINATSLAYPYGRGIGTEAVINTVSNHYDLARTAGAPLMFLDCGGKRKMDHYDNDNEDSNNKNNNQNYNFPDFGSSALSNTGQADCRPFLDDGRLNPVSRYSIKSWSHDSEKKDHKYNNTQMFATFVKTVNGQTHYNNPENEDDRSTVRAIPIVTWNNILNYTMEQGRQKEVEHGLEPYPYVTTSIDLFEAEIKYLHDNGFKVITMADLDYDKGTNYLKIKEDSFDGANTGNTGDGEDNNEADDNKDDKVEAEYKDKDV